ncbi:type II toxin-antitoxin system PemK/MazF family toxin [Bifidobacterium sp. ESL0764]|nr:type II toxin-antitoxin system PemK/MazF family toxin [Bifidobacterium sp. ESL0764]WEV65580.1 type II toxin-antitoxin system PemK/MazF family toxin [Bifidobacterium sp. ESL0764]
MKRGEIWTVRADGYASKPRPVVIVQSDKVAGFRISK